MKFRDARSLIDRRPFIALMLLIAAAIFSGGSNRGDILSLVFVRSIAILCIAIAIGGMPYERVRNVKVPLTLLGILAAWMALQLVPLPPSVWMALPHREQFAEPARLLNAPQPWLAISIVPLRTLGSLMGLSVPAAALLLIAWLPRRNWYVQAAVLTGLGLISGLLAVVQILGPVDSVWYLYDVRQKGGAVGFFANRNHEAALLNCTLPLLAAIAAEGIRAARQREKSNGAVLALSCALVALFVLPLIFITGSRAGLLLTLPALAGSALLVWPEARRIRVPRWVLAAGGGVVALIVVAMTVILRSGRALSLQRLSTTDVTEERRVTIVDPIVHLIRDNLPFGTGFGTFDPAFRAIEPYSQLYRTYLNHAHSDPLEFASDGGIPAILILAAFALWWAYATFAIWVRRQDIPCARAATIATALLMMASMVDYPLRTPLASLVFAMMTAWMAMSTGTEAGASDTEDNRPASLSSRRRRRRQPNLPDSDVRSQSLGRIR